MGITDYQLVIMILLIGACILSVICATVSFGVSVYVYTQWKAKELSTHNIQYVPSEAGWGTSDTKMAEINQQLNSYDTDFSQSVQEDI